MILKWAKWASSIAAELELVINQTHTIIVALQYMQKAWK